MVYQQTPGQQTRTKWHVKQHIVRRNEAAKTIKSLCKQSKQGNIEL